VWHKNTKPVDLLDLSDDLGVDSSAILQLHAAWAPPHKAWAWPMRDGTGKVCGIRLRAQNGKKWSVPGSRSGIFLPYCEPRNTVWICEGGTDAAALMSLNLLPIGRPSCSGGVLEIVQTIRRLKIERAVIIADNDQDKEIGGKKYNPGYDGARRLAEALPIPHCIISLPCKDAREFLKMGGTRQVLESIVNTRVWTVSASSR